jgi:hypothetical protein
MNTATHTAEPTDAPADDLLPMTAEEIAEDLNRPQRCRYPTAAAALTAWRRMRGGMRVNYKGELVAVLEQDGGGYCPQYLCNRLYLAFLSGRVPPGRMTIHRA